MATIVNVPGVGQVRFPDTMDEAQIRAAIESLTAKAAAPEERTPVRDQVPAEMLSPVPTGGELQSLRRILSMGDPALTGEPPPELPVGPEAVAPTAGGLAARLIGPRVGVPGPLSEAFGAMVGEGFNQATGITQPSLQDLLLAGGLSLGGDAARIGLARGAKHIPGAAAVLHEHAAEQLPGLAQRVELGAAAAGRAARPPSSASLYGLVALQNPPIPVTGLQGTVGKIKQELAAPLSKAGQDEKLVALVKDLEREIAAAPGGELPFQRLWATQKRIKDLIKATEQKGGQAHGAFELLRDGIDDAFERAALTGNPALPVVSTLNSANVARTRERLATDLSTIVSVKGGGVALRPDLANMSSGLAQVEVNPKAMLTAIERSPKIKKFFEKIGPTGPAEYEALVADLTAMAKDLPALGARAGADAGSMRRITRIAGSGGAGTLIGALSGADPQTAALIGGSVGTIAGAWAPQVIAAAVTSQPGRALFRKLYIEGGGTLGPAALATLAVAVGMTDPGRGLTEFGVAGPARELVGGFMGGP